MSEPDAHCLQLTDDLLLEAGRLMENASLHFARSLPDIDAMAVRIDHLEQVADDLHALSSAARALLRSATSG